MLSRSTGVHVHVLLYMYTMYGSYKAQACGDISCGIYLTGPNYRSTCPDYAYDRCALGGGCNGKRFCGGTGQMGGTVYYSSGGSAVWNKRDIYDGQSIECCDDRFGCNPAFDGECRFHQWPNPAPTTSPTPSPSPSPSPCPSPSPSPSPTSSPTTAHPTGQPTSDPTQMPTAEPTTEPSGDPTQEPTLVGLERYPLEHLVSITFTNNLSCSRYFGNDSAIDQSSLAIQNSYKTLIRLVVTRSESYEQLEVRVEGDEVCTSRSTVDVSVFFVLLSNAEEGAIRAKFSEKSDFYQSAIDNVENLFDDATAVVISVITVVEFIVSDDGFLSIS